MPVESLSEAASLGKLESTKIFGGYFRVFLRSCYGEIYEEMRSVLAADQPLDQVSHDLLVQAEPIVRALDGLPLLRSLAIREQVYEKTHPRIAKSLL